MKRHHITWGALAVFLLASHGAEASGPTIVPPYNADYRITDLGSPAGVVTPYGGLTIPADNPNILLIGGGADTAGAGIYSIGITRDAQSHINGFSGTTTLLASAPGLAGGGIDGGLQYGPDGVLFYTTYGDHTLGQIKPGSSTPDKLIDLSAVGMDSGSTGGLAFVPAGLPGAGKLVLLNYDRNVWYSGTLTPDGSGTFNLSALAEGPTLDTNGAEGILFVPGSSPQFADPAVLIVAEDSGHVEAYDLNVSGAPDIDSARDFITGLSLPVGAALDPLTGDFLFSTYNGGNHVFLVTAPEPSSWILLGLGALGLVFGFRRRRGTPLRA